ncbi:hypothetical protein [Curtobacterium sp. ISL-83]|uniref:hypothetical protein n=1 Tax=Curtobacterium sp. ISL-83 TaxID=2819145 RepID=UPI001BE98C90|nr:hypothetical protein [Curtobacterium sp. ISL-83]MBT2503864.1 hypothetical protein [Curtobacterium sp. ISL-83]
MRVFAYVLTIVLTTTLTLAGALIAILELRRAPTGLFVGVSASIPLLVAGPVLIGSLAAYWDRRSSPASTVLLRRWFLGVVAVDVIALVVVILASASAHAPVWVPAVFVLGAAVLLAIAQPLGARIRRLEPPMPDHPGIEVFDQRTVRKKVVAIVATFVISVVVVSVGLAVLAVFTTRSSAGGLLQEASAAGQLVFTATAFAVLIVALPLNTALRDIAGRDLGRLRRFNKVVFARTPHRLEPGEEQAAVRFAVCAPVQQGFVVAYTILLYVGVGFQMVSEAFRGTMGVFPEVFLGLMVVTLLWFVPLTVRRMRRATAYAQQHAAVLDHPTTGCTTAS